MIIHFSSLKHVWRGYTWTKVIVLIKSLVFRLNNTTIEESNNSTPDDSMNDKEASYTINKTLVGRLRDMAYSLIGNGYEMVVNPHTATWIVLFFAVVVYYTCFINKPRMK